MQPQIVLAPFHGITQKNYRNAYARHFPGLDQVYAPFISGVNPEKLNPSKFADVVPLHENPVSTVPQFVSINSDEIVAMANYLEQQGYDHINWNMGCPFSRLANKMRGCGLLPYPDKIRSLLDSIMPRIGIKLSIKMRLGYKSPQELEHVMPVLNDYPLHLLILHPRIGSQLYKGEVNLEGFEMARQTTRLPLAYNGDIYHAQRFEELKKQFPDIHTWMIGRAALINPFLAAEIKGLVLSDGEKRVRLKAFHDEIAAGAFEGKARLGFLKSLWYYMSGLFADGAQYFSEIKVCQSSADYYRAAERLLEQDFAGAQAHEHYFRHVLKHV